MDLSSAYGAPGSALLSCSDLEPCLLVFFGQEDVIPMHKEQQKQLFDIYEWYTYKQVDLMRRSRGSLIVPEFQGYNEFKCVKVPHRVHCHIYQMKRI